MNRARRRPALGALAALVALASPAAPPVAAQPVTSGVSTHFGQGWPPRLIGTARALGVTAIRDGVSWKAVEQAPGHLAFTPANSGHVDRACAAGLRVMLGLEPRNPLYDGGQTAFSPAARQAFARFVAALAGRWPQCLVAVEIGNEINGKNGMTGPAAASRAASHVALLREVNLAVKPQHPSLVLLGGSTNTIPVGFLAGLVRAGLLDWADGLAIHPYRPEPEGVEHEIARLRAVMGRADKEIWATEFSREFPRPQAAAAWYLKMAALLEGAGVHHHFWYALADQPGFPTMGLVRFDGSAKPAAQAFAFAARTLAPLGPAVRVDEGDPGLHHFRYGDPREGGQAHVVWGTPRALVVEGEGARVFTADGTPVPRPAMIGEEPLVITGASAVRLGQALVLADSFHGFAQEPLHWFATRPGAAPVPLRWVDWQWTGYLGGAQAPGAVVTPLGIGTTPGLGTLVRYRALAPAPADSPLFASVCFVPTAHGAGTALAELRHGAATVWSARVGQSTVAAIVRIPVRPGESIDLLLSPVAGQPAVRLRYRLRIARDADAAAPCPSGAQ